MVVIREQQMEAFARVLMDRFVQRTVEHLLQDLPEETASLGLDRPKLEDFVRKGIRQAKNYGIQYDHDLQLYVDCMVTLEPEFDRLPWAAPILNDGQKSGEEKMDAISEYMLFGLPDRK